MELLLKISIHLSIFAMCIYELSECWIWTCLNVKEFLAWNKRRIGNLFDCWFGLAKLLRSVFELIGFGLEPSCSHSSICLWIHLKLLDKILFRERCSNYSLIFHVNWLIYLTLIWMSILGCRFLMEQKILNPSLSEIC